MGTDAVHAALWASGLYASLGVFVGLPILLFGIGRIDPAAKDAPWTFRVLVLPGVIALWPFLLRRWWTSRGAR